MRRGRSKSGLEDFAERPGFLATVEQREWLEQARLAAGEPSLSDWIRKLTAAAGESLLGKPFPRRKPLQKSQKKVR
jgi:hypothetical protein